ncbi:nucleotidyltransferase [Candidatus Woesearchaeota archaeon]|nr:nucleotidyltransferase [Candidatus Woesearchaeota archaeon]
MIETLLKGLAKSLRHYKIPYMIVGGQAVLLYGSPRLTRDVDVTLGVDTDAYEKVAAVVEALGLKILPKEPKRFVLETKVLPTEDVQSKFRVDFIFSSTPYERQAIRRAKRVPVKGSIVYFASLEDLIIHKIFAGRAVDLEDVRVLMTKHHGKVDIDYIRRWLRAFSKLGEKKGLIAKFDRIQRYLYV